MMVINLYVEIIRTMQFQMCQVSQGNVNTSEMSVIRYVLIDDTIFAFNIYNGWSHKKVYESNFGGAYETYKEAVKKDSSIRLRNVKNYLSKQWHTSEI